MLFGRMDFFLVLSRWIQYIWVHLTTMHLTEFYLAAGAGTSIGSSTFRSEPVVHGEQAWD